VRRRRRLVLHGRERCLDPSHHHQGHGLGKARIGREHDVRELTLPLAGQHNQVVCQAFPGTAYARDSAQPLPRSRSGRATVWALFVLDRERERVSAWCVYSEFL
jgi:hypothetical protein